jgi:hypothetical protein
VRKRYQARLLNRAPISPSGAAEPSGPELVVYGPDGGWFLSFEELQAERERERQERLAAEWRAERQAGLMRRVLRPQATAEELQELQQLLEPPPSQEPGTPDEKPAS